MQRLLRRTDAAERRIVCFPRSCQAATNSTTLPHGFVPRTRGACAFRLAPNAPEIRRVTWRGKDALLRLDLDDDGPFLTNSSRKNQRSGRRRSPIHAELAPRSVRGMGVREPGQAHLIFSTQANWVESYGKQVVDLASAAIWTRCWKTRLQSPAP